MRYAIHDHGYWKAGLLLAILMLLGGRFALQLYFDHRLDTAQAQWDTEVEKARSVAQAAQRQLDALKAVASTRPVTIAPPYDLERVRTDAYRSHLEYQELQAQAAREKAEAERQWEREQQVAASSSRSQIAALKQALARPIAR